MALIRNKKKCALIFYFVALLIITSAGSLYATGEVVALLTDDDGSGDTMQSYLLSLSYSVIPVTDSQVSTLGFLNSIGAQSVVMTRSNDDFGGDLSFPASLNIYDYVYNNINFGSQGTVFAFTASVKDILNGVDGFGANTGKLFDNALEAAVISGHGYIGELNGAVLAMSINTAGLQPISVLTGTAAAVAATSIQTLSFVNGYDATILGAGVIDNSTFEDISPFYTKVTALDPLNTFVAVKFNSTGDPFLLTNTLAGSLPVPEIPTGIVPLILLGLSGLAFRLKGFLLGEKL